MMVQRAILECPESFIGALGLGSVEAVLAGKDQLTVFVHEACLLHNVGALAFSNLSRRIGRGRLEEEESLIRCHVYAGAKLLEQSPSTRPYVNAALGHHRFFDGKGGYPPEYKREEDPNAALTDLISAAIYLVGLMEDRADSPEGPLPLDKALERLCKEAGTRLDPKWCRLLKDMEPELSDYLRRGRAEAYEAAFRLLRG